MKKKFWIRAVVVFILLVAFRAATSSIAPLINNLLTEMGYTFERQAIVSGVILAVGYIASIFGSMIGGRFADKMGPVKTIMIAGSIFAAAFILWAILDNAILFSFNRTLLALCSGALYVALQSYLLGGVKKGSEGMAMGIYGLGFGVGTALAGTAAGVADQFGINEVFITLGVVCVGAVLLGRIMTLFERKIPVPGDFIPAMKENEKAISLKQVLKGARGSIYVLLINAVVYGFGLIIFLQYLDELGAARGMPGTQAAFGIAVFSIISLMQPVSGLIADKIGKMTCIVIGQILVAIGWGALALMPGLSMGIVLALSAVAGVGSALFSPAVLAVAEISAAPGSGGTLRGVYQGATNIGSAAAAMFGSLVYKGINGIDKVFVLLLISCCAGMATAVWLAGLVRKESL